MVITRSMTAGSANKKISYFKSNRRKKKEVVIRSPKCHSSENTSGNRYNLRRKCSSRAVTKENTLQNSYNKKKSSEITSVIYRTAYKLRSRVVYVNGIEPQQTGDTFQGFMKSQIMASKHKTAIIRKRRNYYERIPNESQFISIRPPQSENKPVHIVSSSSNNLDRRVALYKPNKENKTVRGFRVLIDLNEISEDNLPEFMGQLCISNNSTGTMYTNSPMTDYSAPPTSSFRSNLEPPEWFSNLYSEHVQFDKIMASSHQRYRSHVLEVEKKKLSILQNIFKK